MKRTVKSMTDEWSEFLAYTHFPEYKSDKSTDTTYMGRFVFGMFEDFHGFARILTILARGFLFHTETGELAEGDPYDRIEYARRALLAWCSIPDRSDAEPRVYSPSFRTNFQTSLTRKAAVGSSGMYGTSSLSFAKTRPQRRPL